MADDLQRRIATVLVRSQHGTLPASKISELVDLGVGMATAQLVVQELENEHGEQLNGHRPCPARYGADRCALRLDHNGPHCEDPFMSAGSHVWYDTPSLTADRLVHPALDRAAALMDQARDELAAVRGTPA